MYIYLYLNERCYDHNIFIIFSQKKKKWLVVIGSNLNLKLRLLFYPNSNNLILKIYYKNVVNVSFLYLNEYIYIYVYVRCFVHNIFITNHKL